MVSSQNQLVLRVYGEQEHPIELGDRDNEVRAFVNSRAALCGVDQKYCIGFSTGRGKVHGRENEERVIEFYYKIDVRRDKLERLGTAIASDYNLRCLSEIQERKAHGR